MELDFPSDLLYENFIEKLKESKIDIIESDETSRTIFARTTNDGVFPRSNIYIEITEKGEMATIEFCSARFDTWHSLGKNEENWENLLNQFEESLII